MEDFRNNFNKDFTYLELQLGALQEKEHAARVEEKEEVNLNEILLPLAPINLVRNWKLFFQWVKISLSTFCFFLHSYKLFSLSFLSVSYLEHQWKFDPSGVDFQFLTSSPSPRITSHIKFQPKDLSKALTLGVVSPPTQSHPN